MAAGDFWNDQVVANKTIEELKDVKDRHDAFIGVEKDINGLSELHELSQMDESMADEFEQEVRRTMKRLDDTEIKFYLSGKFDKEGTFISINAGAGGTEACDWASMLLRMYQRWADIRGFKWEEVDSLDGDGAGIKSATIVVRGPYAYGYAKAEQGVHRLVRISPFDSNKRRHTSFASVDVLPEVISDIDIVVKPDDIRIDTFRASGAGGQHVNKTDSAVRITHIPTNIVVSCQNGRSQHQNREFAMNILKSKLFMLEEEKRRKEMNILGGDKKKIEWGSQIRSYVLHPYQLVKDHRTDHEWSQSQRVLDGEIDEFINAYLKAFK
jgi:peptide chain release factor 2